MVMWNPWRGCHKCSEGCRFCYIHKGDAKHGADTNKIVKTAKINLPIEKYMMKHAINDAFNRTDHIFLEVDSHNPPALRLYRRCGFQIVFQVDYFKITI